MIGLIIKIVAVLFLLVFGFAIGFGLWRLFEIPLRKGRDSIFDYVYVDENGNARELTAAEEEFLSSAVFPSGEVDRFIKSDYLALNADGGPAGYIQRRRLPRGTRVAPAEQWDQDLF
jgi:hypothetical protein